MKCLPRPIKEEFEILGEWVISKTANTLPGIPFHQAHEQENRNLKGSGGCIGLAENPVAFRRWMMSGTELSRLWKQFESEYLSDNHPDNPQNLLNHEQGLSTQKTFADESVIAALYTLEDTGKRQHSNFVKEVLEERKRSIHEPIRLNKPALFRKPSPEIKSKQGKEIKALENNVSVFGELYISIRAVKGIWKNSFPIKFDPFLPHCQNSANFICRAQSLK